jgi:[protein-PII] uridylyltransferase
VNHSAICLNLKLQLNNYNQSLIHAFHHHTPIAILLKNKSLFIDSCLQTLWQACGLQANDQAFLLSVGGYGRQELFLHSDIDILILHDNNSLPTQDKIELFLQNIWNLKLSIGHSVSDFISCIKQARTDVNLYTNLLEMRYVCGNQELFQQFNNHFQATELWSLKNFLDVKVTEAHKRQEKHPCYHSDQEPDIKNSLGSLRDLQTIVWLTIHFFKTHKISRLIEKNFITKQNYDLLKQTRDELWKIRYALHILNNRNHNKLMLKDQLALTQIFNYPGESNQKKIESFMQHYFMFVNQISESYKIIIDKFKNYVASGRHVEQSAKSPSTEASINALRMTEEIIWSNKI